MTVHINIELALKEFIFGHIKIFLNMNVSSTLNGYILEICKIIIKTCVNHHN